MKKTTDNENNNLACNDNHKVHHFITICSFFLTKDYSVVLGWRRGVTVSRGGRLDVVLPCHPHLNGLSGSLQWPALQLRLQGVAPCCWSQLSLVRPFNECVCVCIRESVCRVILGLLLQRRRQRRLYATGQLCTFMSFS